MSQTLSIDRRRSQRNLRTTIETVAATEIL